MGSGREREKRKERETVRHGDPNFLLFDLPSMGGFPASLSVCIECPSSAFSQLDHCLSLSLDLQPSPQ